MNQFRRCIYALRLLLLYLLVVLVVALSSAFLGCCLQVYQAMQPVSLEPAQAAVVLGTSVLPDGSPSAVLRARTLAAVELYDKGLVEYIATTGGVTADYPSEGSVAASLAMDLGVPEQQLIVEGASKSTWENLSNLVPLLHEKNIGDVIIVSDSFHLARAQRMALDLGLSTVQVCAAKSVISPSGERWYQLREVGALLVYLFLGSE